EGGDVGDLQRGAGENDQVGELARAQGALLGEGAGGGGGPAGVGAQRLLGREALPGGSVVVHSAEDVPGLGAAVDPGLQAAADVVVGDGQVGGAGKHPAGIDDGAPAVQPALAVGADEFGHLVAEWADERGLRGDRDAVPGGEGDLVGP